MEEANLIQLIILGIVGTIMCCFFIYVISMMIYPLIYSKRHKNNFSIKIYNELMQNIIKKMDESNIDVYNDIIWFKQKIDDTEIELKVGDYESNNSIFYVWMKMTISVGNNSNSVKEVTKYITPLNSLYWRFLKMYKKCLKKKIYQRELEKINKLAPGVLTPLKLKNL